MFQLRGLGDCTSNPSDPVCLAFYGPPASNPSIAANTAMLQTNLFTANAGVQIPGSASPVTTQNPTPGTNVNLYTTSSSWYTTWWGIGLILLAGIGAWKYTKRKTA